MKSGGIFRHKIFVIFIAIFLCAVAGLLLTVFILSSPFKVKDPFDPRFDPMKFQFEDYPYKSVTVFDVIQQMFPVGTTEEFVDSVLVDSAGAVKKKAAIGKSDYWYEYYSQKGNWRLFRLLQLYKIFFFEISWNLGFDYEDKRLRQIYPSAGCLGMLDVNKKLLGCQDHEWLKKQEGK